MWKTPANVSQDAFDQPLINETEMVILMIMLAIFSVVGSIGNMLVIFVFQRVRDKSTAQVFIIAMAVIDLFTCAVIIPMTMLFEYNQHATKSDFVCKLYHFLITSKIPLSALIMVTIAVDRYFCICHPLRRVMTLARAKVVLICLVLLACLLGMTTSLFHSIYETDAFLDTERLDLVLGSNFTAEITKVGTISNKDVRLLQYLELRKQLESTNISAYNMSMKDFMIFGQISLDICVPSGKDSPFFKVYQCVYMALYPVCLITVMVLYLMIYRFICLRRSKKLQQKLIMCSYVNGDGTYENTRLVSADVDDIAKNCDSNKPFLSVGTPGLISRSVSGSNGYFSPLANSRLNSPEERESTRVVNSTESRKSLDAPLESTGVGNRLTTSPTVLTNAATTPTTDHDQVPFLIYAANNGHGDGGCCPRGSLTDRSQLVCSRRHSRQPEQKYHWHKNRDSMRRYKGINKRRRSPLCYDAERLREENRSANARTALMLFAVTLVFMIAFIPSWFMALRLIGYQTIIFYLYFSYNVINPFIYAFMNRIFKDHLRKILSIAMRASNPQ